MLDGYKGQRARARLVKGWGRLAALFLENIKRIEKTLAIFARMGYTIRVLYFE